MDSGSETIIIPPAPQPDKNHTDEQLEAINNNLQKIQANMVAIRSDVDKLKATVADKVPKAVLSELEGKISTHTRTLDGIQRKMHELNSQITSFAQQPIANTLLDTLRTQLTQETMEAVKKHVANEISEVKTLIDDKTKELQNVICNAKRVMFHR